MQEHRYDVLIVGAGGAGMRAAIEAGPEARTAALTKLYPTRSHTGAAQGGMCAALANVEEDNWEWHTFDTVKGGDYLADQDAVEIMAKEAIDAVLDLEKMGMPFNRTPEGRIDQRRFGGHTRDHGKAPVRRACYAADRTGHMILQTLYQNCVKHDVEFFNEYYALDIAMTQTPSGPVATGVIAYELATGDIHVFHAKAIVFATGGSGRMYKTTSNAHTLTGDGLGIIFRKGLPLEDMEFHQFHPTGLAGLGILISEAVRGEGGRLLNGDGERFMERYAPTIVDLAPRDIVARAIDAEIKRFGLDYVHLDISHQPPEFVKEHFPTIHEKLLGLGIDMTTQPIPVVPAQHYTCGGVLVDLYARTDLPGLWAAGECTESGLHGANRLASNSLLECFVFGEAAARDILSMWDELDAPPEIRPWDASRVTDSDEEVVIKQNWTEIRRFMWNYVSIVRSDRRLARAQHRIELLHDEINEYYWDFKLTPDLIELRNIATTAKLITQAAQFRKESRGLHYNLDHPERDDQRFAQDTLLQRGDDPRLSLA